MNSFEKLKLRMNTSGSSEREEKIKDSQRTLSIVNDKDVSFCDTLYFWNIVDSSIATKVNVRLYERKHLVSYGDIMNFQTLIDDPLVVGDVLNDTSNNTYWLCVESYNDYTRNYGRLARCNYTLLFQRLTDYSIVAVPCITSTKTFDADESKTIVLGNNKKSLLLPKSIDTLSLKTDRRVYIDTRNETPYKLLDPDTTTYNYGDNGLIYIIAEQSTGEPTSVYKDRPELGICNYHEPVVIPEIPEGSTYSEIKISGDLLIGGRARTLTATVFNADDTINMDVALIWTFVYPIGYESLFVVEYPTDRSCTVKCGSTDDYDKLIGKVVKVSVSDDGNFVGSLDLKIKM